MIRAALILLAASLSGCAGVASYTVEPFMDSTTGNLVCCRAIVLDAQDKASVTVTVQNGPGGTFNLSFSETSVSATAPIAANAVTASAVAGAISNTAISAAKILH